MKVNNVHSKGYALATNGGVVFNLGIDVPADRFGNIQKNNTPFIAAIVENGKDEARFRVICLSKSAGFWGEDEKLTLEEEEILQGWVRENGLIDEARAMVSEDERLTAEMDKLYEKHSEVSNSLCSDNDSFGKWERLIAIDKEIDELCARREALRNIKI